MDVEFDETVVDTGFDTDFITEGSEETEIDVGSELIEDTDAVELTDEEIPNETETDEEIPNETEAYVDDKESDELPEDAEKSADTEQDSEADLARLRQDAIAEAWVRERDLVLQGKGTRDWTVAQQQELIREGKVTGFEGQHMLDASTHPEYAGDPNNIQWLTYEEHFFGAHGGKWANSTNGRLDYETGEMISFAEGEKPSMPVIELTDKYDASQDEFVSKLGREFGYQRKEDNVASRLLHKGEKSNRLFGKS